MPATRADLDRGMMTPPQPRAAAMEATIFTGWIYDHLLPHAAEMKVAHPLMLRAIALAKKKNDRIDAARAIRPQKMPSSPNHSKKERARTLAASNAVFGDTLTRSAVRRSFAGLR
jgi:hypothetical protein